MVDYSICSDHLEAIIRMTEAFHGKCDSFERDIIIGRFRSFSTIVTFDVLFDSTDTSNTT